MARPRSVTACCGVAVATVSDVQLNARGATLAVFSVLSGVGQKMLNEHLQQRGGLSTLQLMDLCFPAMTVLAVLTVPLMDKAGVLARVGSLSASEAGLVALSSAVAVSINYSTTLVLGVTNALALGVIFNPIEPTRVGVGPLGFTLHGKFLQRQAEVSRDFSECVVARALPFPVVGILSF